MGQWSYLAVMLFIFLGTAWLEVGLRTRVYRRWRRLLLSVLPVAAIFYAWDVYAIGAGHWWFDEARITGVRLPGSVPIDELVFFVMVPIAAVLTLEAVRSATGHRAGDEEPGEQP
jgi:lycopene cyclase domain-containing protein